MQNIMTPTLAAISERKDFRQLSRSRNRLGATLAIVMAIIYFAFILMVAFYPATLGSPIAPQETMSLGVVLGVAVMAVGFLLTAFYVIYASSRLDEMVAAIRETRR